MVKIDKVYQRVLALANKEQRGYINPKDFNLFAEQAQLEIIDQYYYDLNQFSRLPGNSNEYSDIVNLIEEKIGYLSTNGAIDANGDTPVDLYRLGTVYTSAGVNVQHSSEREYNLTLNLPLIKPTEKNPIYYWNGSRVIVKPSGMSISCSYIKKPNQPKWGYVVVNKKPLHDSNSSKTTNFVLHPSEESELVYKILSMAGVSIQKPQLTQVATGIQAIKDQQEKL
tara:strand:- start:1304 stop:1978 length:675 start_codon:yes stop_codon:yes gene_type:complete